MTKKIIIIAATVIAIMIGIIALLTTRLKAVTKEKDLQTENVATLLTSVQSYKTKDSLMAASVGQLQLTLDQYKQYRSEDAKIIDGLNIEKKRLQGVITSQTESYYENTAKLQDSIRYLQSDKPDSIYIEKVKTATFSNEWHWLNLVVDKDSISYKLKTRESLIVTNHVIPKRFLGFLWNYGVKEIKTDIVSKNPYTEKISVENMVIRN